MITDALISSMWTSIASGSAHSQTINCGGQDLLIEHFHMMSSPLRLRRKEENHCHVGVQQNSDLGEWNNILINLKNEGHNTYCRVIIGHNLCIARLGC